MGKGNLFDSFFEDRTEVDSECNLSDVYIKVSHDEIRKIDSVSGFTMDRKVKSKSVTIEGFNGNERLCINITGNFEVTVKCEKKDFRIKE